MTAAARFAEHAIGTRFADLSAEAVERAKVYVLGSLGVGIAGSSVEEVDINLKDMVPGLFQGRTKKRRVKVPDALAYLTQEEEQKLIDMDSVVRAAVARVEQSGIIFVDEIDKIAGREGSHGPEVSREGVQRDILPIVEGTTVNTKHGMVRTDHILFIAAGAFHVSKPSDLIPELQGRFPIRVELEALGQQEFVRILTEPRSALIKQYTALMATEGVDLRFTDDGVAAIAELAAVAVWGFLKPAAQGAQAAMPVVGNTEQVGWLGLALLRGGHQRHGTRLVARAPMFDEVYDVEIVSPHHLDPENVRVRA